MSLFKQMWSRHLRQIGIRQLDVMILIIYVFALAPTVIIGRIVRRPSLALRGGASWVQCSPATASLESLRRMS